MGNASSGSAFTDAQLDGVACVLCGVAVDSRTEMVPAGMFDQTVRCADCKAGVTIDRIHSVIDVLTETALDEHSRATAEYVICIAYERALDDRTFAAVAS